VRNATVAGKQNRHGSSMQRAVLAVNRQVGVSVVRSWHSVK